MTDTGDATPPAGPVAPVSIPSGANDVAAPALAQMPGDRAARRAALRDLAAMIGVEVFY